MDLRTIKTYQTIVKYDSFQRAAEVLYYAQSTVTTQIKNLKTNLGVILLEKDNDIQLIEAGRLLHDKGEALLNGSENLQGAVNDLVDGEEGIIRIGVMEPTASFRLPAIISSFKKEFPKVQVKIQIQSSKVINEMLKKDEIDIALCTTPDIVEGTYFEPLFSEEVVLLIPNTHYLRSNEVVLLKHLQNEELLITKADCPFRSNLEKQMKENGLVLKNGIEVSDMLALRDYVQANIGVAVVPNITVIPPPKGTLIKPIIDYKNGLTVGILTNVERFNRTKAMMRLMELLENKLKDNLMEMYA